MSSTKKTTHLIFMVVNNKFISYIESRVQSNNELYGRFHIGSFSKGQGLTLANTLRRTLLSEIPALLITKVEIEDVYHEFDSIEAIQENILDVLLNFKNLKLKLLHSKLTDQIFSKHKYTGYINYPGPGIITANDIHFPENVVPVDNTHYIATCSNTAIFTAKLVIEFKDPNNLIKLGSLNSSTNELLIHSVPKPVKQVNYTIQKLSNFPDQEYISLEIWTDGSIDPQTTLTYILKKLTTKFFQFANLSDKLQTPFVPDDLTKIN